MAYGAALTIPRVTCACVLFVAPLMSPPFRAYPRYAMGSSLRARWDPLRVGGLPLPLPRAGKREPIGLLGWPTYAPVLSAVSARKSRGRVVLLGRAGNFIQSQCEAHLRDEQATRRRPHGLVQTWHERVCRRPSAVI